MPKTAPTSDAVDESIRKAAYAARLAGGASVLAAVAAHVDNIADVLLQFRHRLITEGPDEPTEQLQAAEAAAMTICNAIEQVKQAAIDAVKELENK